MLDLLESLLTVLKENDGDHKYSSTQIQVPSEIAEEVLRFSLDIPDSEIYTEADDKGYGRETDIHVTVKYGLTKEVTPEQVKEKVQGGFTVVLGKTFIFPASGDTKFDVLGIEIESPGLKDLNSKISQLPNEDKHPTYKPHMTIAYLKAGKGNKYEGKEDFVGKKFEADCLYFKSYDKNSTRIEL